MSLWHEVRGNVIEWYTVAAERTEVWAQLGVRHYDRYGLHRRLGKEFAQLGGEIHALLQDGEYADLADQEAIRPILDRISRLEAEMRQKEDEIATIREGGPEPRSRESAEETPSDAERDEQSG